MLTPDKAILVVVDVQGKLAHLMHEKEALFDSLRKVIQGVQVLGIPILCAEQNPDRLGPTIPEVAELLCGIQPISKLSFSCCRNDRFVQALEAAGRSQVLIAGIETHVCVYQTALDLLERGYEVEVVTDAVSSRTPQNKEAGLQKMRDAGVGLTTTEMVLFELLQEAQGQQFREILKLVK